MTRSAPLFLDPEICTLVDGALDSGNVLLLAVVDSERKPHISPRGSAAVYSDDQLCLWVRNTRGATIEAIRQNPQVALMYRSPTVPLLEFVGRARIAADVRTSESLRPCPRARTASGS